MSSLNEAYQTRLKNRICSCRDTHLNLPTATHFASDKTQELIERRDDTNQVEWNLYEGQAFREDYRINTFGAIPDMPRDMLAHNMVDVEHSLQGVLRENREKRVNVKYPDVEKIVPAYNKHYNSFQFYERPRLIVPQPLQLEYGRPLLQ